MSKRVLSIVIPRYLETEDQLFPLITSISNQVGFDKNDIEVIIANDGEGDGENQHRLDDSFFDIFNITIRQVFLPKSLGPGVARQYGIDASRATYVMCCDADDMLHNVGVIGALLQEIDKNAPDILTTSWLEELRDAEGNYSYLTHENDNTWMFGKCLRRQFLIQHNIRFHNELRWHEDSYLLFICRMMATKHFHLPITSYLWKYRDDSITRINNGIYGFESIPIYVKAMTDAWKQVEGRCDEHEFVRSVVQFTLYMYFTLHQPQWLTEEHKSYHDEVETEIINRVKPFWKYFEMMDPIERGVMYTNQRAISFVNCIEQETLDAWVDRLGLNQPEFSTMSYEESSDVDDSDTNVQAEEA